MLDLEFSIVIFECLVVKLSVIIGDDDIEKTKSANGLLKEVFDFIFCDVYQGFCLHPFGEVVDSDNKKLLLASC